MKANELMAGDYFRVAKDVCIKKGTVVEIRSIDTDNNFPEKGLFGCASCRTLDENQFTGGVWLDYLEPIPLTPEILEKNFREYLPGINLMYQLKGPYFAMNEEGNQWVFGLVKEDGEKSCRYPLVKITYVHQLQHALRLCGIKKEIVL